MPQRPLRKIEKPLVVFLRLYGPAKARMKAVCRRHSTDHNAIGMAGTLAELGRLETMPAEVSPELIRLATEHRRLGGDPEETLKSAIAALEDPEVTPAPASR
jgi:hypothetical protein